MRNGFRYIFSFFLILALLGLGESVIIRTPNLNNIKQSEWVNKTSIKGKISKCYQFSHPLFITNTNINLHAWSFDLSKIYDRLVSVKLISQSNILRSDNYKFLIFNKLYSPRNFVEGHNISKIGTDSFLQDCPESAIKHDSGDINWNTLLNEQWKKQIISPFVFLMGSNVLQNGFGEQYI